MARCCSAGVRAFTRQAGLGPQGNQGAAGSGVGPQGPTGPGCPCPTHLVEILDAKEFGATGNGVTDDTAALQAAVDATVTQNLPGGSTLFLPPGNYRTTGLTLPNADILIFGAGRDKTKLTLVGAGPLFNLTTSSAAFPNDFRWLTFQDFGAFGDGSAGQVFFRCSDSGHFWTNPTFNRIHVSNIETTFRNVSSNLYYLSDFVADSPGYYTNGFSPSTFVFMDGVGTFPVVNFTNLLATNGGLKAITPMSGNFLTLEISNFGNWGGGDISAVTLIGKSGTDSPFDIFPNNQAAMVAYQLEQSAFVQVHPGNFQTEPVLLSDGLGLNLGGFGTVPTNWIKILAGVDGGAVKSFIVEGHATGTDITTAANGWTFLDCRNDPQRTATGLTFTETGSAQGNDLISFADTTTITLVTHAAPDGSKSKVDGQNNPNVSGTVGAGLTVVLFTRHNDVAGMLGVGSVKNTGANSMDVTETLTDFFGNTGTVTQTVAAGAYGPLSLHQNPAGTAHAPYKDYSVSVTSANGTTYNAQMSIAGSQTT